MPYFWWLLGFFCSSTFFVEPFSCRQSTKERSFWSLFYQALPGVNWPSSNDNQHWSFTFLVDLTSWILETEIRRIGHLGFESRSHVHFFYRQQKIGRWEISIKWISKVQLLDTSLQCNYNAQLYLSRTCILWVGLIKGSLDQNLSVPDKFLILQSPGTFVLHDDLKRLALKIGRHLDPNEAHDILLLVPSQWFTKQVID